ncbi:MAG: guanylate kinase [bacterium]
MGLLLVVSSPSGCGKTTVVNKILKKSKDFNRSVSYTTRPRQNGEINGQDYNFLTEKRFKHLIKKSFFIEWANVHGYLYGTSKKQLLKCINGRKDTFYVIDVIGGLRLKKILPHSILIFLAPPKIRDLNKRIEKRKRENKEEIKKRLKRAVFEFEKAKRYDYLVINDDVNKTVALVEDIVKVEKYKSKRNLDKISALIKR